MTTEVALSAAALAVETAKTTVFAYWLRRWKRFDDQRLAERQQQFEAAQARSATLVQKFREASARTDTGMQAFDEATAKLRTETTRLRGAASPRS